MTKEQAIEELAAFFTGALNGYHSVGLELGSLHAAHAKKFFSMKEKLLGTHVMNEAQAVKRLTELLG